ncbi:MAG: polyprenyl synthetase family protein [Bryobacteraceae bacterium]|jgi:octaprenyl-diphosphate synthase
MAFGRIGRSLTALEIFELVRPELHQVEREIGLESVASADAITYIGQYLQSGGGKRLRPILVLLCGKLLGPAKPALVRMAAVVEMIHTATLVHDDVIDMAKTRRGRPSINVVWGNHTSVLAGDWLYMQAFQVALRERNFLMLDLLMTLTQMMVEGELLQLERIGKIAVTEADYMELIDRKTASLFSACARLGAMSSGVDEATETRLGEYAWNLGIAFQLVDDILDFTSREKILGKPVGNDLREGKVTLPLIYALESAEPEERRLVETVLADGNYDQVPFGKILQILNRHGGIERAQEKAQTFTQTARTVISEFPDSTYQRALLSVTDLITERDH